MQEADKIRLKHLLDASIEIVSFTEHKTQTEFEQDRKLHLSVVHLLGSLVRQVTKFPKRSNSSIPLYLGNISLG